jgi:hypothetical protein
MKFAFLLPRGKGKDVWGSGGKGQPFLTSSLDGGEWSVSRPGRFTPGKDPPVPIGYKVGWAPKPVWTLWSREKYAGRRTPAFQPLSRRYNY